MARQHPPGLLPLALALCLVLCSVPEAEGQNGRELVGAEQGSYMARALAGLQSGTVAQQNTGAASTIVKPKMVKVKGSGKGKGKNKGTVKRGAGTADTNVTSTPTVRDTNTTVTPSNATVTPSNSTGTASNTTVTPSPVAVPSPPLPSPNPPSVSAAVAHWRAFRANKVFSKKAEKNLLANIGKTWTYSFRLGGAFVVGPKVEEGDPEATGTVDMSVTMLKQSLFSDGQPTYQIKASMKMKGLHTSGFPTTAVLKRGSEHYEGKTILPFPGTFTAAEGGAVLTTVVGDTSAVWSEFQVPATAAMEYLIRYPGHHYVEVWTTGRPKGAIRGQLVKTLDSVA